jgi:hypothetical protein
MCFECKTKYIVTETKGTPLYDIWINRYPEEVKKYEEIIGGSYAEGKGEEARGKNQVS